MAQTFFDTVMEWLTVTKLSFPVFDSVWAFVLESYFFKKLAVYDWPRTGSPVNFTYRPKIGFGVLIINSPNARHSRFIVQSEWVCFSNMST